MISTGDALTDYDWYEAAQVKAEKLQPHCSSCGNPIWDEYLWDINGSLFCEDCASDIFRHDTEDYIDDGSI